MSLPTHRVRAVLDANVLYPQFLRDVLLRLADGEIFQPLWTDQIQAEWRAALIASGEVAPERVERARLLMEFAFPHARLKLGEYDEESLAGIHPGDRHVAAAAIQGNASHLVTFNLKHFPAAALRPYGIEPVHPDAFVASLLSTRGRPVLEVLERHRILLKRPPYTRAAYREAFRRAGLEEAAKHLLQE